MSSTNLTHDKKITQLLKTPPLVLRLSSPLKNSCLDPRKVGDRDGRTLLKLLFEGLTRFDKQGKVALSIAKSCAASADQTRYRITLRRTYWSNGDPVIASDFEYSWKTALAPDFPMDFPSLFYMIKQAKQAKRGKCLLDDVGIQAKNPRTLLITLNHPVPDFLERLAHPLFLPIPSSIAKKNPSWVDRCVFNGPFCLKDLEEGAYFYLRKNKRYFRKKWVKIDQILIAPALDKETSFSLKDDAFTALEKNLSSAPSILWVSINTSLFPTRTIHFRKALIAATDREKLKHLFPQIQDSAIAPLPSYLTKNRESSSLIHYNPAQACAFFDYILATQPRLKKETDSPTFTTGAKKCSLLCHC